ncbi:TetR/AcrR family transcriptional regulator [Rhizobium sp. SL42]|uniref:TetR/AcrR family transcriptional regulator n=1 Tax=Rhizobium sp. SL42 TaxID=2806346 RepID=UPI001F3C044A|nr:TetR/AcrR family transcriptional regulator [Rhizobium sp. SL42]UJW76987.1 TetR/AcrR family transcriptional regulator [Rhizobium sp. SL42]
MSDTETTAGQPAAKRKRGRPKTHSDTDRRSDIIDTARKTFVELGFSGTTTDIVAARCRISKQTLYRLFPSKSDLFLAVIAAHRQMMLDLPRPPDEDDPVDTVLEKIFMIDIDEEAENERQAVIHIVMREGAQFPEIAEILRRDGIDRSRQILADWLSHEAKRGKLVIEDPLGGARMLMDMLFGAMGPRREDFNTRADRRRHLERCIALFVRGTRPT